jgi:hypothetical protein
MNIINFVEFKVWLWGKFEEWRKGTTNGPTAFARYLGIDKQQSVSDWLNGKYKPKSQEHIAKIAEKYPEVYDVLGIDKPSDPFDKLPPSARGMRLALEEIKAEIEAEDIPLDSPEAEKIVISIMERYGFRPMDT